MDQLTPEQNREEVQRNERVLAAAAAPVTFKGIRPPFGGSNPAVQKQLIELGYTYFLNRISTEDWLPERTSVQIADAIMAQLRPGMIIGMHDGPIDTPAGARRSRRQRWASTGHGNSATASGSWTVPVR